jgi:hypothetical protein
MPERLQSKDRVQKQLQSLGGEFFRGDWTAKQGRFCGHPPAWLSLHDEIFAAMPFRLSGARLRGFSNRNNIGARRGDKSGMH